MTFPIKFELHAAGKTYVLIVISKIISLSINHLFSFIHVSRRSYNCLLGVHLCRSKKHWIKDEPNRIQL